jgi:type II secretory pathway component GspD/PulD (secretin)
MNPRSQPVRPVRRRVLLPSALLALALAQASCASPEKVEEPQPKGDKEQLSAEEFRAVLAQGTIRPVHSMEGEDVFAKPEREQSEFADPSKALAQQPSQQLQGAAQPPPVGQQPLVGPPPVSNPYLTFGERIKVNPDGTITKPFPLRVGTGEKLKALLESYGNLPLWTPEMGPVSPPDHVKIENLAGWDIELYQDLRDTKVAQAAPAMLADWLVVTAGPELLGEVEDFINLFAAGVPQIEIEAKIVEITFTDALDLGAQTTITWPEKALVGSLEGNFPNQGGTIGGLLGMAAVENGVAFDAVLQALASRENVSIISQPKIAVREGGRADILNTTKLPYINVTGLNPSGGFNAQLGYLDTGVKLYVAPRVVGTQTVALNIDVEASQQSGNQVILVSNEQEVGVPIISTRGAHTVVYLQPGQAVILGGLISERNVERVRKVPILGDIPLLGYLFKSRQTGKEQTNVLFFIRPRILQGSDLYREF